MLLLRIVPTAHRVLLALLQVCLGEAGAQGGVDGGAHLGPHAAHRLDRGGGSGGVRRHVRERSPPGGAAGSPSQRRKGGRLRDHVHRGACRAPAAQALLTRDRHGVVLCNLEFAQA
jgi:hypothetical protein